MNNTFYLYRTGNVGNKNTKLYLGIKDGRVAYNPSTTDASIIRMKSLDRLIFGMRYIYYTTIDNRGVEYYFKIINTSFEINKLTESDILDVYNNPITINTLTTFGYTTIRLPKIEEGKTLFTANDIRYSLDPYNADAYKIEPIILNLTIYNDFTSLCDIVFESVNYRILKTNDVIHFADYHRLDIATADLGIYGFGSSSYATKSLANVFADRQVRAIYNNVPDKSALNSVRFVYHQYGVGNMDEITEPNISYFEYTDITTNNPMIVDGSIHLYGYYAIMIPVNESTNHLFKPPVEPPPVDPPSVDPPSVDPPSVDPPPVDPPPVDNYVTPTTNGDNVSYPTGTNQNLGELDDTFVGIITYPDDIDPFLPDPPVVTQPAVVSPPITGIVSSGSYTGVVPASNICFAKDTMIQTDQGLFKIQNVTSKHTIDNDIIVGVTKTINNSHNYLIEIAKDAFRPNVPSKRIKVTRSHMFRVDGEDKLAYQLTSNPNVRKVEYKGEIMYNILLEKHKFIKVHNMWTETLHPNNKIAKLHREVIWNMSIENTIKESHVLSVNKQTNNFSILNRAYTHLTHRQLPK